MSDNTESTATGSSLCGAVRYTVHTDLRPEVRPCHCTQCRKQSGHFASYVAIPDKTGLRIEGEENITWYRASETAKRGFCKVCGSHLIWAPEGLPGIDVSGGTLDRHPPLHIDHHIFVADKGDYYEINDPVPQHDTYPED